MSQNKTQPGIYILFAIGNFGLSLILFISAILLYEKFKLNFDYSKVSFLLIFASVGLWLIFTSISWFIKAGFSYILLFTNIFSVILVMIGIFLLDIKIEALLLLALLPFLYILVLIGSLFYSPVKKWPEIESNSFGSKPNILIFLIFAFLMSLSHIGMYISTKLTSESEIKYFAVYSSGGLQNYEHDNVSDLNKSTWWTPSSRSGINSWIKVDFESERKMSSIKILNGSNPEHDQKYGNLYIKNSRVRDAILEFSHGQKHKIHFEDKNEYQTFDFPELYSSFIKIRIISTYKGNQWNDLCITEIVPMELKKPFD